MRQTPWLTTNKLYITEDPVVGYAYQCVDESGNGQWMSQGGGGGGGGPSRDGFYATTSSGATVSNNVMDNVGYPSPGPNCVIAGVDSICQGDGSVTLGAFSSTASATSATVVGGQSTATATGSLAVGPNNMVAAPSSSAVGSGIIMDGTNDAVHALGRDMSASAGCQQVFMAGAGIDAQGGFSNVIISTNTSGSLTADSWSNSVFIGNSYDGQTFQVDESVHIGNAQSITGSSTQNVVVGNSIELGADVEGSVVVGSASTATGVQCLSNNAVVLTAPYESSETGVAGVTGTDCDYSVVIGAGTSAAANSVVLGYAQTSGGPSISSTIAASTCGRSATSADRTILLSTASGANTTQYELNTSESVLIAQCLTSTPAVITGLPNVFMTSIFNGLETLYMALSDTSNLTPSMTNNIVNASPTPHIGPTTLSPDEIGPGRRVIANMGPVDVDFTTITEPTYGNALTLPSAASMRSYWKLLKPGDSWDFIVQNNCPTSVAVGSAAPVVSCGTMQLVLGAGWIKGDTESLAVMPLTVCEWRVVVRNVTPGSEQMALYRVTSIAPPALLASTGGMYVDGTCDANDGSSVQTSYTSAPSSSVNTAMVEGGNWTSTIVLASVPTFDVIYAVSSVAGKVPYITGTTQGTG
jgi:hypothetical protein